MAFLLVIHNGLLDNERSSVEPLTKSLMAHPKIKLDASFNRRFLGRFSGRFGRRSSLLD
jgi:hypothetical protein